MNIYKKILLMLLFSGSQYLMASQSKNRKRRRSPSPPSPLSVTITQGDAEEKTAKSNQIAHEHLITPDMQAFFNTLNVSQIITLLKTRPRLHRKIIAALSVTDENGQEKNVANMHVRRGSLSKLLASIDETVL
jgi:hypothetical protein